MSHYIWQTPIIIEETIMIWLWNNLIDWKGKLIHFNGRRNGTRSFLTVGSVEFWAVVLVLPRRLTKALNVLSSIYSKKKWEEPPAQVRNVFLFPMVLQLILFLLFGTLRDRDWRIYPQNFQIRAPKLNPNSKLTCTHTQTWTWIPWSLPLFAFS